jgi:hypothetical protein
MRPALGKGVAMNRLPTEGMPKGLLAAFVLFVLSVILALPAYGVSLDPVREFLSAGGSMDCNLNTGSLLGSSKQQ